MAYEVKIYGDIVHVSDAGENKVSLLDVQNQLANAGGEPIKVRLNGNGGDVDEGFAIYYELRRYAKTHKVPVHTFAESRLNSIYTVIFLAGDERELCADLQPFVHKAHYENAKNITPEQKKILDTANNRIAQHYADHTDLTFDEAMELMEADTFIPTKMAKKMRFATKVEKVLRPAAFKRFTDENSNTNTDTMIDKKKKGIVAQISEFLKGVKNKKVFTADQGEIDFYELLEDEPVEVGANATIDGKPAEGEVVNADGETYVFAAGVLTEIKPKEEVAPEDAQNEELVALQAELAEAKSTIETLEAKNETLVAKNTKLMGAVAKFSALEAEFDADEPKEAPKAKSITPVVKGAKAASAVAGYTKNLTTLK